MSHQSLKDHLELVDDISRLIKMLEQHNKKISEYKSDSFNLNIEDLPGEEWRYIKNFDNKYQVSNFGRVKSLDYIDYDRLNRKYTHKSRILTPGDNGHGYLTVNITHLNETKKYYIHRLVAQEFIPNPNNLPQVNHKDENKYNNHVENLEWCDQAYNNKYGTARKRIDFQRGIAVSCFDRDGHYIKSYYSARKAEEVLHCSHTSIMKCIQGELASCGGMRWKPYDPELHKKGYCLPKEELIPINEETRYTSVSQFTKDGEFITSYLSIKHAAQALNIPYGTISSILRTPSNYSVDLDCILKCTKPEYISGYKLTDINTKLIDTLRQRKLNNTK